MERQPIFSDLHRQVKRYLHKFSYQYTHTMYSSGKGNVDDCICFNVPVEGIFEGVEIFIENREGTYILGIDLWKGNAEEMGKARRVLVTFLSECPTCMVITEGDGSLDFNPNSVYSLPRMARVENFDSLWEWFDSYLTD